jgi:thiamine pyrophosphate-dependent acetolactate synthase large subunit-like protein
MIVLSQWCAHQQCCLFSWSKQVLWCRYQLPIVVVIMNNSGIYGGDRRQQQLREAAHKGAKAAGFGDDPEPTSFVPDAKYAITATL